MKKAFTLVELVVAVALLAMVISFSSVIFKVSIDSHRTAAANVEIMQKLRAITEQLNADFKGLQKDAPLLIWFDQDDANDSDPRFDQIMFFTVGDFQSSQLYYNQEPTNEYDKDYKYVRGNAARVYYGLAKSRDPEDNDMTAPYDLDSKDRVLARRQHILTSDGDLYEWPVDPNGSNFDFEEPISVGGKSYEGNEIFEHDTMSLTHWKNLDSSEYSGGSGILDKCFYDRSGSSGFPQFDSRDPNTFHKLLCQGVASFAVQWYYEDKKGSYDEPRWFPSADPDNDGSDSDSDFDSDRRFGAYFNIPGNISGDWKSVRNTNAFNTFGDPNEIVPRNTNKGFFPEALKFTFRLVDSESIITETDPQGSPRPGRTFTHIVYLKE